MPQSSRSSQRKLPLQLLTAAGKVSAAMAMLLHPRRLLLLLLLTAALSPASAAAAVPLCSTYQQCQHEQRSCRLASLLGRLTRPADFSSPLTGPGLLTLSLGL
jgi:hypothetical protein